MAVLEVRAEVDDQQLIACFAGAVEEVVDVVGAEQPALGLPAGALPRASTSSPSSSSGA